MKVERWKEETDEDWAERLADEISLANDPSISKYFVERDPYDEEGIIINYIGEKGWTWKEHPEGPFKATQIIEWKRCYDVVVPTLQVKLVDLLGEIRELQSSKETTIKGGNE